MAEFIVIRNGLNTGEDEQEKQHAQGKVARGRARKRAQLTDINCTKKIAHKPRPSAGRCPGTTPRGDDPGHTSGCVNMALIHTFRGRVRTGKTGLFTRCWLSCELVFLFLMR